MEDENIKIEEMMLNGLLEFAGVDIDSGEMLYRFTEEIKYQEPELFKDVNLYFTKEMMSLWENGFIEMDITEENPMVRLTEKSYKNEEIQKLSKENQFSLREVLRVLNTE